jgi:hypothetical protein
VALDENRRGAKMATTKDKISWEGPTLSQILKADLNDEIKRKIADFCKHEHWNRDELPRDIEEDLRLRTAKEHNRQIQRHVRYVLRLFPDLYAGETVYIPNKTTWLTDKARLHICKKTKFSAVYNFLYNNRIRDRDQTYGTHGKNKWPLSIVILDTEGYERMSRALGMAGITIKKYLQRFCKLGILKLRRRGGGRIKNNPSIYAIGYYQMSTVSEHRFRPFLTQTQPGIKALENFRAVCIY